jgi:hypothetical protein
MKAPGSENATTTGAQTSVRPGEDAAHVTRALKSAFRALLALALLTACQTTTPMPPVNLAEQGWQVRQGQAVWVYKHGAPGLAGELLLARHSDGRALVQFSKSPLPLLTAQVMRERWQIEFSSDRRTFAGAGEPPGRFLWLHLARCLEGKRPPVPLQFQREPEDSWLLVNTLTGESVAGYLAP